ncbi:hypothetical protein N7490_002350 [Penicillium lividum]|nr:hypothetical protein N7490_002350 [Penicillium lividum]
MNGRSSLVPSRPTSASTGTPEQHTTATESDRGDKSSNVEAQQLSTDNAVDGKNKLQDQTNLLPVKQLVSTALPTLGRVFHDASVESWVGTSYLLTSTACQPLYGRLSDIFGRKIVLLTSMGFFLFGSILSAVSQSMIMLIVFRAISGIGGGGILTSVMITVSDVVSLEKRGTYQGIIGVVVALSNSIGPLIGGLFTEKVSWRWCFYINIPLTGISILVVLLVLPLKRVKGDMKARFKQIDYLGCITMLIAAVLILLPISWGGTKYAWSSAGVIAPLIIGVVFLGIFILVEIKFAELPLIPMHIFKNSTVAGASIGAFFTGFMFYANLYYLPQFFQVVYSASPIKSGVLLLPLVVIQCVVSFTSGFLISKTGNYTINMWAGFAIWAIACGLLSTISSTTSIGRLVGYQILSGIGSGQTLQTNLVAIQANVERKEMAVATATRNFLRLLGGTVALAACGAILNNTVRTGLSSVVPSAVLSKIISDPTQITSESLGLTAAQKSAAIYAYTHGIRNIYYFMVACCCVSFFITISFVRSTSLKRDDDARLQEEGKKWAAKHRGLHALGKKNVDGVATEKMPTQTLAVPESQLKGSQ